jgi:hypothetical protein
MPCEGQNVTSADDFQRAWETLQSGLEYLAMINYPYNTSFLMPVPANPIEYGCMQAFNDSTWEANVTDTKSEIDLWK